MVRKIDALINVVYAIHADMLSISITGKDCERFVTAMNRLAQVQEGLQELSAKWGTKGEEDGGDS